MSRPETTPSSNNQEGNELQSTSHSGSTEGTSLPVRRGRSHARPWAGWGEEKKILVWNEFCQPISQNGAKLATQLGYFARQGNVFPLDKKSWDEMEENRLNDIWENVKLNTNAPDGYKSICVASIGAAWKRFKHKTKQNFYNAYETDEERLAHPPPLVEIDQWEKLVSQWGTEESQQIATRNAQNRANLCAHPRTGKKPFAVVIEEMKEQNMAVDKLNIFRYTRQRDQVFSQDDGAAEMEETIKRKLAELSSEEQNDVEVRNKIFEDVVGPDGHGRSLCMGTGIRSAPKRLRVASDKDLEVEVARLREQMEEERARLREQMEEERIRHKEELDQAFNKSKEYFFAMMRRAGLSIPNDTDLDTSSEP